MMENNEFIFQISPYDIENLWPQASKALEKRMELVSRERYPALWKKTDKLNAVSQGRTRSTLRTRIMSMVCLALGIFLFVPGLTEPQKLLVPLFSGAIAIGAGIGGLWRNRKHKKNPFDQAAKSLLAGKDTPPEQTVSFSETGMTLPTDNSSSECVPYSNFECIIETADMFLLVYDTRVTVLQKIDLTTRTAGDFRAFISQKVLQYRALT